MFTNTHRHTQVDGLNGSFTIFPLFVPAMDSSTLVLLKPVLSKKFEMGFGNQKLNSKEIQLHRVTDTKSQTVILLVSSLSRALGVSFSFLSFASPTRVLCHLSSSSPIPNLYWKFRVLLGFFVRVCVIEILPLISNSDIIPFKGSLLGFVSFGYFPSSLTLISLHLKALWFNPFDFALLRPLIVETESGNNNLRAQAASIDLEKAKNIEVNLGKLQESLFLYLITEPIPEFSLFLLPVPLRFIDDFFLKLRLVFYLTLSLPTEPIPEFSLFLLLVPLRFIDDFQTLDESVVLFSVCEINACLLLS
ncbi:hypothetical protein VNO77_04582 [Canavalia gladiata]|uniref:Uncharacterized protein n=1 Tax=Canavalia gladiata TaxID=3824 RepID=A0AAN9N3A1_CANGL